MMLRGENLTVRYGKQPAVQGLSFQLEEGQWLMLVGPNGAGKSTLLRAIAQTVPCTGHMTLDGVPLERLRPAERAKRIGVLAQQHSAEYGYTVEEIVSLGRYAHRQRFLERQDRAENERHVLAALEMTGMTALRQCRVTELSGGELQRAFLAQVFAQNPQILLLDEPANHLDLPYQKHIFDLIAGWVQVPGRAVISVVHDLGLARRYGSHALLLREGMAVAQGTMQAVLTADRLAEVYGMDVAGWMQGLYALWQEAWQDG